jgi:hypothetical protein
MMKIFLNRSCPICQSKSHSKPYIKTIKRAENLTFNSLISYWNGFFKEKIIFSYVRCNSCGLLFCPKFFTNQQLKNLYGQMPPNMDEVPKNALTKTQYGYFKTLKNLSNLKGGYLEIGPDIGLFTEHCVREGSFDDYWLFEPNKAVKNDLKRVVNGRKAKIIHEMTNFSAIPNNHIDVVIIIHVMDHLLDPVGTLSALRKKLKKDGKILIVTHDEASLLRKIFNWKWPAFCLQHPQIYNLKTTKELLRVAGFDVLEQHKTVNYFKLSFLFKHLLWAVGLKFIKTPRFFDITLGLKLGNILTIASPSLRKN